MISNRDNNTNLQKEVLRKKKAMQAKAADKQKKKMIIAYSVIGSLFVFFVGMTIYNFSNSDDKKTTDFQTPETTSEKYNSKLEALESKQRQTRNPNLLDVFNQEVEDTLQTEQEISPEEQKLQEQLDNFGKTEENVPRPSKDRVYGDYSMWETKDKSTTETTTQVSNREMSYQEKLKLAKEARNINNQDSNQPQVETRIAVFRDQFLLPGELAEFILTKEFTYQGQTFKKGTPVYGYITILKTRVLFEIKNIAHVPLNLEVRDIRDGLIGMYSSNAGQLWKQYQAKGINENTEDIAKDITNNKLLSNSINTISKFFQKTRIKENEKIMLLNDQELIVNILNP